MRSVSFIRDQKGAVSVIEAALVYPVVIISCIAMIYAGMFMYESAVTESRAASAAVLTAKNISFSGLDELADDPSADIMKFEDDISVAKIREAYSDHSPYRYLFSSGVTSEDEEKAGRYATGIFLNAYASDCSIEVNPHILSREVVVTVSRKIKLPQLFSIIGLDNEHQINVSARALTSDPAEFIRNTDLACQAAEYFSEKFGIEDKKNSLVEKVKKSLENFGVKK